jgi:hypothetical protein
MADPLVELVAEEGDACRVVDGEEEGSGCGANTAEGGEFCDGFGGVGGVLFIDLEGVKGRLFYVFAGIGFCEL